MTPTFVSKTLVQAGLVAAALVAGATAPALADEMPRAQVHAELLAARASGVMDALHGEDSGSAWLASHAVRAGEPAAPAVDPAFAAALLGEDAGSAWLSSHAAASTATRAEVTAELLAARARGDAGALLGEDSGSAMLARRAADTSLRYAGPGRSDAAVDPAV